MPYFYEFFAGGGMARSGLGAKWSCAFANDFDPMKARVYRNNWGCGDMLIADINRLGPEDLPLHADLAWASFPCQDLSLAGNYEGIGTDNSERQTRSGAFWPFVRLMRGLASQNRAPKLIALENVCGALTSNKGRDFATIAAALSSLGYRFGAMVIDAKLFVPQSRPRLFIVAAQAGLELPQGVTSVGPTGPWFPKNLLAAHSGVTETDRKNWLWWQVPAPPPMTTRFADLIQDDPEGCAWHSPAKTASLLAKMNARHLEKVSQAKRAGRRMVGGVYKRTRIESGVKVQRAEVRFDDLAGCLRTPAGGSSRQSIVVVDGDAVRSRLLSPREAARLMGLADDYKLPESYNEAYHVTGDGVVVPVVRHLAEHIFEPVLRSQSGRNLLAAE